MIVGILTLREYHVVLDPVQMRPPVGQVPVGQVPLPTPSPEIIQLLSVFATAFTAPTWAKALVLLYGTILAPGRRTVTAALRAMGLADEKRFEKYHLLGLLWGQRAGIGTWLGAVSAVFGLYFAVPGNIHQALKFCQQRMSSASVVYILL